MNGDLIPETSLGDPQGADQNLDLWPIYNPDSPVHRAPHSIYFEVLGEHGYLGLTLFLLIGFTAYLTCSRTHKLARGDPNLKGASDLAKMLQVSLVGYAAAGTFLNVATFDLYYHVLAIIIVTRILVGQELKQPGYAAAATTAIATRNQDPEISDPKDSGDRPEQTAKQELGGASGYLIKRR